MMQILQRKLDPLILWTAVTVLISSNGLAQVPEGVPVVSSAAQAKFAKFPNLPDCFTGAVEHGNPSQGPSVILIKGSAGCAVPWHWHTPNEQVMMARGTARVQAQDGQPTSLRPGAYFFMPSHHVHRFKCITACLGFVHSDGVFDLHYVDQAGKEIPADQALKAPRKAGKSSERANSQH